MKVFSISEHTAWMYSKTNQDFHRASNIAFWCWIRLIFRNKFTGKLVLSPGLGWSGLEQPGLWRSGQHGRTFMQVLCVTPQVRVMSQLTDAAQTLQQYSVLLRCCPNMDFSPDSSPVTSFVLSPLAAASGSSPLMADVSRQIRVRFSLYGLLCLISRCSQ